MVHCSYCGKRCTDARGLATHQSKKVCYRPPSFEAPQVHKPIQCSIFHHNDVPKSISFRTSLVVADRGRNVGQESHIQDADANSSVDSLPLAANSDREDETDSHLLNQFQAEDTPYHLTKNTVAETELLSILCDIDAPLHAYQSVMNWASKNAALGYQFNPTQTTYQSQVSKLKKTLCMQAQFPTTTSVVLPLNDGLQDEMPVTAFEFVPLFHSLLSDPNLNNQNSLSVNPDDPFAKYLPPDNRLGEVHSGTWYQNAWEHMSKTTDKDFMIGIILYIDKTCLSFTQKLSVHPVNFSLSIFTEKARSHPSAWRTLGYLPMMVFWETPIHELAT